MVSRIEENVKVVKDKIAPIKPVICIEFVKIKYALDLHVQTVITV